ncbi:MAG: OmpA family protein, partial [Akkermansiaceae bacterium]|nr:OmpA family protein [Akkermansiaceae bacterium]
MTLRFHLQSSNQDAKFSTIPTTGGLPASTIHVGSGMANGYSLNAPRLRKTYRLPGPNHLGWWATLALIGSILLHVVFFLALDRMKIAFKFDEAQELSTRQIDVRRVEVRPPEAERSLPPEEIIIPPKNSASLLDEVDLLNKLPKDQEIDIKPEVTQAEYALKMQTPAVQGTPETVAPDTASGFEVDTEMTDLGRQPDLIKPAEIGQITVDPGTSQVDESDIGKFTEDLIQRGANGKTAVGTLDGMTSLDSMLDLPSNILLNKKTMLPSDLLFDFNSSELRESAKVGLMKLCLLIDRNPNLYCWIEGHTDLVGGDEFNLDLSIKRSQAVKNYLTQSLHVDASKIITRGFGRYEPIITTGNTEQQAVNRRVEVRMRQTPPPTDQIKIQPKKASVVDETPAPSAILVKPRRAIPVPHAPAQKPPAAP